MKITGIIPARYASTRFPGKPLIDIGGKPMIQRVYEQAMKAGLDKLYVATDDERIIDCVKNFRGKAVMTSADHLSGTDRCSEACALLKTDSDIIVNIQGDEPFIDPEQIRLLTSGFEDRRVQIATLVKKESRETEVANPNTVKVVLDHLGDAIYFSRSPIPYRRNPMAHITYYRHIGIYAYSLATLQAITGLPPGKLELAESLEQLRWIEAGFKIRTKETEKGSLAIDTPADLEVVNQMLKKGQLK